MHGRGVCVAGGHGWQLGVHGKGGMHGRGACVAGGMHGRGMCSRGHGSKGGVNGKGHACRRRSLKRAVRILLECILVFNNVF